MLQFSPLFRSACRLSVVLSYLVALLPAPVAAQPAPLAIPGHCLLLPMEPERRARQSSLVVEAEVRDARSFWDAGHRHLFTRHRLRVLSLLKGAVADTAGLVVVTEGGQLALDQQLLTNTLRLGAGQRGVFFLVPAPWPGLPAAFVSHAYAPFGSEQGFIAYQADGSAVEPFLRYAAVDAGFYQQLAQLTGQPRRVLLPGTAGPGKPVARGALAPVVAGLSPQVLPAGTGAVLTITGAGFGSSRGSGVVEFKNADDGGATRVQARAADYLAWTDTRIQVRVPSTANGGQPVGGGHPAGSGPVRVATADQLFAESLVPLTVIYALTNVESTTGELLQRPNHIALNATGGITFRFGPNFVANAAATAAWQRALATWRCQTGMSWDVGPANGSDAIAEDGQNVVAFDGAGNQLPDRVLGRTTSYYRGCYALNGEVVFWVKEIDMQFDDGAVFQFGPALAVAAQIDFETVVVHELGHAQQLNHLILPGAVMHYAIARAQNTRSLNPQSDVAGGRQVLRVRSFRNLGCSGPPLLPAPLVAFDVSSVAGSGIAVTWATRDECFLSGFAVERSQGADTTTWQPLATVATRPPASQYQFVDARPLDGLHYYRLRLLRPDGSLDSAAPVLASTDAATVSVFPNPVAGDQLSLQYPSATQGNVVFRVYDELGRQVRALTLTAYPGINILSLTLAGLVPGFYVLRWQDTQGAHGTHKFVRI